MKEDQFLSVEELTRLQKEALRQANLLDQESEHGGISSRETAALCNIWIKKGGYPGGIHKWSALVDKMKDSMLTDQERKVREHWKQYVRDSPTGRSRSTLLNSEIEDLPWLRELKQRGDLEKAPVQDRRFLNLLYPEEKFCNINNIAAEQQKAMDELARIEREEGKRDEWKRDVC